MSKKPPEACLFCGEVLCQCSGSVTKKKAGSSKTRTATARRASKPTSPSVTPDNTSEDIFGDVPTASPAFQKSSKPTVERDLSYLSAIRVLRDIVSGPDQRKIDRELNPPYTQSLDRRVVEWRKKHGKKAEVKVRLK